MSKPRVMIAGTNSGCGKTTVTAALLAALRARNTDPASFKCGPDYIDPMFHKAAVGVPSFNLDPFFCDRDQLCHLLQKYGRGISVLEGVMGYYDGVGAGGRYSSYRAACDTYTPVILVMRAKGMYTSAGAVLQGFLNFRNDSNIRGVIFNDISPRMYLLLAEVAKNAGILPLGFLPHDDKAEISSRHLGLITAGELPDLNEKIESLRRLAEENLDIDGICALAEAAPDPENELTLFPKNVEKYKLKKEILTSGKTTDRNEAILNKTGQVRIAVACDEAFCFLYQENLDLLSSLGAVLVPFSPLHDLSMPDYIDGLYLPGGYPELHAEELSHNTAMKDEIKSAVKNGLPTIAECGGFLYLHTHLDGYQMADVIHADAKKTDHLQHFGYVTLTAQHDNLLGKAGTSIRSHEFHYYESTDTGHDFKAEKASGGESYACIHSTDTLYAGFPHLYLPANPVFAGNFIQKAAAYGMGRKQ